MDEISGNLVVFGGGHGLAKVLAALAPLEQRLTAVVATTDNGGSTGRLRDEFGGIAWGDLRHCLESLVPADSVGRLLLNHRFQGSGTLAGHSLGNLMLLGLNELCVEPEDAIAVLAGMLGVQSHLLPMSAQTTELAAEDHTGQIIVGETQIDALSSPPKRLFLMPEVDTSPALLDTIEQADWLVLGPGSVLTSIMPALLIPAIRHAVNNSSAKLILIDNLQPEAGTLQHWQPHEIHRWMAEQIGRQPDAILHHGCQSQQGHHYFWPLSNQPKAGHEPMALRMALTQIVTDLC
ncbi:uridine diphosphate-N-acetylglucosamine-binding protein YvcK [Ferrimonas pelagia]